MAEVAAEPQDLSNAPLTPGLEPTEKPSADGDGSATNGADEDPKEQLTVFHSPENFTVKHPLMSKWTLWFTRPPSAGGGKVIHFSAFIKRCFIDRNKNK